MTYDEWYEYLRYCRAKSDYIAHHGILGQKWYRRRYQNADGSLTAEGKIRYNKYIDKETKRSDKYYNKQIKMDKRARHELARQKGHLSVNPFKDRKQKLLLDDQIQVINRDIDSVSKVRDAARNKISNYTPENIEDEDRIRRASRLYNLGFGERERLQRYRETGELPKYVQKQKDKEIKNKRYYNNGVKGMKQGARKEPDTVFVSGSSKTTFEDSGYYRRGLPKPVRDELDSHIAKGSKIVVGDAPGIDRQVQDYLNSKDYGNVVVYGPGKAVRYSANKNWKTNPVDAPEFEAGSKEWLAKKDIEMSNAANKGIAVVLDNGSSATRKNVDRLIDSHKDVKVYALNGLGEEYDSWINPKKGKSKTNNHKRNLLTR